MDRRDFLRLLATIPAWSLWPSHLIGANKDPHFFVLIMINGGMDVTLGLDPRIQAKDETQKDIFIEYRPEQIIQAGELLLGPASAPLKDFHNDILIINGINMRRDAGHESTREYLGSGLGDGRQPFLPVEFGVATGNLGPAGILQSDLSVRLGNHPLTTLDISQAQAGFSNNSTQEFDKLLTEPEQISSGFEAAISSFNSITPPMVEIFKELKTENTGLSGNRIPVEKYIAKFMQRQLSYQAVVGVNDLNLDTHSNHAGKDGVPGVHWNEQLKAWNRVTDFFKVFKKTPFLEKSLFDYTTFMVVTEFSRTPFLNASNGKDHNPLTNSILLTGPNIATGKSIGKSHVIRATDDTVSTHIGTPIDYTSGTYAEFGNKTQLKNKNINFIYPENIARTLFSRLPNLNANELFGRNTAVIPGILKD